MANCFSVSMNSYSYGKFSVAECLEQIRRTPIGMVELPAEQARPGSLVPELMVDAPLGGAWQYSLPDLRQLLADCGLRAESVDVFGYLAYPGGTEIVKRRVEFAAALGAETIVLGCHHRALVGHSRTPDAQAPLAVREARGLVREMLREAGDYAADRGIRIALETHEGTGVNATEALRTLEAVGRGNVGVNFDTANILYYNPDYGSEEARADLEALAPHVFHVHLKDIIRGKTAEDHILPRLGLGEVDLPAVFEVLGRVGFSGPYSFEVETFHRATDSDEIGGYHEDLLASIEHIRAIGQFSD